ncbi:AraC family transcriptional regulator [Flaviaesturariibacter flavus]|uniref:AraC family transcriptional regulator n=1 Tax=Flaviaesturariibacter flavus TaxID=2502780 RepID=A0A4R1B9F3_9BACT|nr:helix-turn-helix domain-containing protein [Flaviaesturariibacter flavus]TCJ13529.1 AraC family transcriptional regulator [Flaviaesturariibacter flavus]
MQHIEFFDRAHFAERYHRQKPARRLAAFIDFFWETDFDTLWKAHPQGFSDALFPNVGYTYMLNLGTPFVMQLADTRYPVKQDIFLPRQECLVCHHQPGNRIFGIKFRVSPIVLEKDVNFSEYRGAVHPLSYLIDRELVQRVKAAPTFARRMAILSEYYERMIDQHEGARRPVALVTGILKTVSEQRLYAASIADLAARHNVSPRTLQRYFLATTGMTGKQALQILRIRNAVELLSAHPGKFNYADFGYYDHSHFYKHLREFFGDGAHLHLVKPHLQLLRLG